MWWSFCNTYPYESIIVVYLKLTQCYMLILSHKETGLGARKHKGLGKQTLKLRQRWKWSHVQLFATPWTEPTRLLHPWDSPGKNTGVGCHFLLQGIFPTQGSNPGIEPGSPALEAGASTSEPPGKLEKKGFKVNVQHLLDDWL